MTARLKTRVAAGVAATLCAVGAISTVGATAEAAPGPATAPNANALSYGQTAHLQNFDVTAMEHTYSPDGGSQGFKVKVCSTGSGAAGDDGLTRVSTDPWQILQRDGEAHGEWAARPISSLPAGPEQAPVYGETRLAVGQCAEGWMVVKNTNPDTQTGDLRYVLADGTQVSWK